MNQQNKISIRKKLLAIQSQLVAPKGQTNKFGNYQYRSAEDILQNLKPLLAEHGCVLLCSDRIEDRCNGDYMFNITTVSLCDCDSDLTISVEHAALHSTAKKGMDAAQISGSTASYALKRALGNLFAIDNEKDADATNKHGHDSKAMRPKEQAMELMLAIDSIKKCKEITELQKLWSKFTDGVRSDKSVITAKDEQKTKLTQK
jgi:hypothetical protein